jgi:hypothetical protein
MQTPENNYVMANIRIPIEVLENGEYHLHSDRIFMEFEKCEILPPISNNGNILEKIKNILNTKNNDRREEEKEDNKNEVTEEQENNDLYSEVTENPEKNSEEEKKDLMIYPSEILKRPKPRQNITFRKYSSRESNRSTRKKIM